ncbi:MAG TPA: DUF4097 family beta strand repeat-containing protein [Thermoanaerobaculia bacterium]|nr:DUF4097 family beta strand repeat-containing protein [Thermoanaerobaculia bacterium]
MRSVPIRPVLVLGLALAATPGLVSAETVRTVRAELTGADARNFAVENLLGTMRVSTGSGPSVEIVATVHAETAELADAVRLEKVTGAPAAYRVRYPYDKVSTFKYREPNDGEDFGIFGWSSSSSYDYDGHHVKVNHGRGTRLYADLDVRVPAGSLQARFASVLGLIDAEGLQGELEFRVASADMRLRRLEGRLTLEGSSGDVRARDVKGTWSSDFSSGDCELSGFEGDALTLHTTSGDLRLRSIKAKRADVQTTSGDVRLLDAELQELSAEASSGDVEFDSIGAALKDARIRTSSGDVRLRLPESSAFDVDADQSSGDMDVRFSNGSEVSHRDRIVGYRHGTGGAHIRVRTSSGDLTVSPS